jgi:hypothetical protein
VEFSRPHHWRFEKPSIAIITAPMRDFCHFIAEYGDRLMHGCGFYG